MPSNPELRAKVAVHKFNSCDGCQLAFLNMGEDLLKLTQQVDIVHFAEAGPVDEDIPVDIAFIEGSIATPHDQQRIEKIRANSRYLISIGACATSGGIQALRNMADAKAWVAEIYARPEHIHSLDTSTPISQHIKVDLELWGCPVNGWQVTQAIRSLLFGAIPEVPNENVCQQCKRQQNVCVLVTKGEPCMGPVTRTGCGALCPSMGRACYACYGPAENINTHSLYQRIEGLGLLKDEAARCFLFINSGAKEFHDLSTEDGTQNK
ncbi:NAD-reducing hydrogenase HoxS subunit delta [bacterium BMS3Bbin11]|nr:NAD-reducing hydrogenase HoxS subunit delta [bacterium BMS3Abin11]GBE46109.1 NAD-reducing hydrogenase HoxS subunit delta [bacterium BMS3Bbin11]HDH08305.1 sulfhydrogenase subunit delta [Gammaproteobacteria bacterium]HDH14872.1 sulfhydrogenase subunit delta [Gammaproteobacteria bacterium]HDZ78326.1 sulfhydrogenase subunit delta [Gammaproteobacteria bacterium]